jgi:purine-binding chemotaxis protein CheW
LQSQSQKNGGTLVEMCSVRLGQTLFGVPITHILEIVGSARPQPVPLAPVLWAAWFTIAATC